ncbi:hypothetical protein DFJ67_1665 [Asanoa ferruginea]|uniref:Excreted virulence factor EspC (Type VII ESX diderm) n=1 Tax=Asanoa ferruginea TaxID=53367 RepID=A0A3D9ZEN0_9ACTN|nr:hypothetical protein [Asanoa ferruginea]REF95705.1 hypothetical protein DFJ67_1665 [Asanoa ferruginea]GIF51784.1 hypothetical protein Afe04nite_63230 [Asanoa ferruginea]
MTSPLSGTAGRLDSAAASLGGLAGLDPGASAFGAGVPGALGALGRELHGRFQGELAEHARAAAALAGRMTETASTLRAAGEAYSGVEGSSAQRSNRAGES